MTISPISSALLDQIAGTTGTGQTGGASSVDPSNFMQLLLTQMTNQNPMEPMNDSEMMNQMVELNTLQELQTMKLTMDQMASYNQTSYAASLVGKVVSAENNGQTTSGKVTGVTVDGSKINVQIGDTTVPLGTIKEIKEEEANGTTGASAAGVSGEPAGQGAGSGAA